VGDPFEPDMQASKEDGPSQDQDTDFALCASCRALFIQKSTSQILATRTGLRFRRNLSSLLTTALDDCILCREFLRTLHHISDGYLYGYFRPLKWPVDHWASTLAAIESAPTPTLFNKLFRNPNPEFRFQMRGDIASRQYIKVLCDKKKLKLEVTTKKGIAFVNLRFNIPC
jgi:hypothetical protein